jgi:hypothetical protein
MHVTQQLKFAQAIAPAVVDGATATAIVIDTLGFSELAIIVSHGVCDDALTAFKLQEGDTNSPTEDIDNADYSTDGTLPTNAYDGLITGFFVNLQNRKRYIKVVATAGASGNGQALSALALLARAETVPSDATSRGLAQELIVIS